MTRINTNVSSLIAQKTLARSNADLQEALVRLSTGLRINVGKDDPAGLIASESLRSDIIATERAITNSERANQLIATADSALGQVSDLLNDIRGLVSEAANTGPTSERQIAANQLQVDSSLEAIDRIAQITTFQGRRLLDGTLDFVTSGVDSDKIRGLSIDQANFGTLDTIGVQINVVRQATRGTLNFAHKAIASDAQLQISGRVGAETISFAAGSTVQDIAKQVNQVSDATGVKALVDADATKGSVVISSFGKQNDIVLTADQAGFDPGNVRVKFSKGDSSDTNVTFTKGGNNEPDTLNVALKTQEFVAASAEVDDGGASIGTKAQYHIDYAGNNNDLIITANNGGSKYAELAVSFTNNITGNGVEVTADYTAKTLKVNLDNADKTVAQVIAGFAAQGDFTATVATVDVQSGTNTGAGTIATADIGTAAGHEIVAGVGADENKLLITSKIKGAGFNGVNVNFVDSDALRGATDALDAGAETFEFLQDAKKAAAFIDFSTASADILVTATNAGSTYNDVKIVFTANDLGADQATATYDANSKQLNVDISNDGSTTVGSIRGAIDATGLFTATKATGTADATTIAATDVRRFQGILGNTGVSGGDAGTLYIEIENNKSTANNIVSRLLNTVDASVNALFTIINDPDQAGTGVVSSKAYAGALTGGIDGGKVLATSGEVVQKINDAADLDGVLTASLIGEDLGTELVTDFSHFAYTGEAPANNRLQFLGGEDSRRIRFVAGAAGSELGVDLAADPRVETNSRAIFDAKAVNASLVFEAIKKGPEYDNVLVLFEDRGTDSENTVVYNPEATKSNATIAFTGTNNDIKLTAAADKTLDFNNVQIVLAVETGKGDKADVQYVVTPATASTAETRVLTVTVDDAGATKVQTVIDAINSEATFSAALDTSAETTNDGSGVINQVAGNLANTNNTGSINGTLTIRLQDATTTAADVVNLLAGDSNVNKIFRATHLGSSTGAGVINVATDTATTAKSTLTSGGLTDPGTLVVNLATDENGLVTTTAQDLINYFDEPDNADLLRELGLSISHAEGSNGTGKLTATEEDVTLVTSGTNIVDDFASATISAVNGIDARFTVTALNKGADFDGVSIEFIDDGSVVGAGDEVATYDAQAATLTVNVKIGTSTAQHVIDAINNSAGSKDLFQAATVLNGDGSGLVALTDTGVTSGGTVDLGSVDGLALVGNDDGSGGGLSFISTEFGSASFVQIRDLNNNSTFQLTNEDGEIADRNHGKDVDARVNGVQAIADGLRASINTATLDLSFTFDETVTDETKLEFAITGGGAQFQLGPRVVSNQQARLGIQSVSTATLGSANGRLFELRSGGAKNLAENPTGAAAVVDDVITSITELRGRLGAFQRTTLETNIFALNDTLAALTEAESSIRDADFAVETAKLTRAQILVQSGTTVLQIANQNPQNVLALLR